MSGPHPSLDITGSLGEGLRGKRLVLCVAGSVAAYRAVDLARLLMRHGASVTCVASRAALGLISAEYLRWATGNEVVTNLTGDLEHIRIADRGRADGVIVYPATANTLGKLANGIDDTPVSTVLTTALGAGIPITICPAMHQVMYENPAVRRNIEYLEGMVGIIPPDVEEGKAKAPDPQRVLEYVLRAAAPGPLAGKRVLMTAGPTVEYIDPVRVITNVSTGMTGMCVARCLVEAGAQVTIVYGPGSHKPPTGARVVPVRTSREMAGALDRELEGSPDVVIMAAAVSDYAPLRPSGKKIKSSEDVDSIPVRRVPKMINRVRDACAGAFLVGFKAETGVSAEDLVAAARGQLDSARADLVVANDVGRERYLLDPTHNEVVLVDGDTAAPSGWMPKEDIARHIVREIGRRIGG